MKIGKELMKIDVKTAIDVFNEDFRVLIKEEPSKQYKEFEKSFQDTIDLHNSIENITSSDVINTHKVLTKVFHQYITKTNDDVDGICRAYDYYSMVYNKSDFARSLKQNGISVNYNELFLKKQDDRRLVYALYNVRSNNNIANTIKKLGKEARSYFESFDDFDSLEKEKIDDIHNVLFVIMHDHIKEELDFYDFLNRKFKNNSIMRAIEEALYENIEFAYENLLFYISHYGIYQSFEIFDVEFDHTELLKVISNNKHRALKIEIEELIDKSDNEDLGVFENLSQISNRFYSSAFNNLSLHTLAEEIREQMIEVVTDCIWEDYPEGDLNGLVNVFASFTYLYKYVIRNKCNISEFCSDELDLDRIFASLYKDDIEKEDIEKFEKYLICIYDYQDNEKLKEARDIFYEYEFPYYYKLLNLMELAEAQADLSNIPEQDWLAVDAYLNKLEYLEDVITGDIYTSVFPTLAGGFIDFSKSLLKIDINSKNINPMKRIYSTFKVLVDLLMKNIEQKNEIEALNESLEDAIEAQNDIVSNYSHAWKHMVFPSTVKDIAVRLIEDFDKELGDIDSIRKKHREYSAKLMKAYRAESIMKRQGELLVLKHSADNLSLQNEIRSDVLRPNSSEEGISIQAAMEESLEILLFEIIMKDDDASNTDKSIRKKLFSNKNLDILREDFSKKFVLGEKNSNILEWICDNVYPVEIKEMDKHWKNIKLKANGNASVFFIDIFTELFYNAFKYNKAPREGGFINISLTTITKNDEEYLQIYMENPKDLKADKFWGTGSGIKSLNRLINKINCDENTTGQEKFAYGEGETIFATKVQLVKSMFVKRGRRRRNK